ncbi:MAG: hypothetical protein VW270_01720 [Candidatus Poseidoniales archaeon]
MASSTKQRSTKTVRKPKSKVTRNTGISTQSAKAKGRRLQQTVRDAILEAFSGLESDDVRSTSMGAGGEDVLLSPAARKLFPYTIECKNLAKIAVYNYYVQATGHNDFEPLVVVKQNRSKPLAIVDFEHFMELVKYVSESKANRR